MRIHFSHVLGTLNFEIFVFFHIFPISLTMGTHFSHILGIEWINVSHEICKKPRALECFCFLIRLLYYENSLFSCFWFRNCIGFHFTRNGGVQNMYETHTFGIFVFSHNFLVLSKFTIPMFWFLEIVWFSAFREICKKHYTLECSVFQTFSLLS